MAEITGILSGSYNTLVKRSDGKIVSLGDFQRDAGGTTIVGVIRGAYNAIVQNSDGNVKSLADHVRDAGGATVSALIRGGYGGVVKEAGGSLVAVGKNVIATEVAQSVVQSQVLDAQGDQ